MESIVKLLLLTLFCLSLSEALTNERYYPRYHLAPVKGWLNDPNGFWIFNGEYHLAYQHNPESSLTPGTTRWGHAKSKDLFHWVDRGIAINNNSDYDRDGVFSGSAVVDSGIIYLYYTGNVNFPGEYPDKNETQALVTSTDAVTFTKYEHNPIILGEDLQPNIRDPKVWKQGNSWYMLIGNSFINSNNETLGRVVLFKSADKINWDQVSILGESDGFLGYMWECPDLFEMDGRFVFLFAPQGVKAQGDRFKNLYQTGYIVGQFDYTCNKFTPETEFVELDFGHDFYTTQTLLDKHGRRLMVAWMDTWDASYPEGKDGFTGHMTIIRTLSLSKDNRLIQKPVREVVTVRAKELFKGKSCGGTTVTLPNKAGEVLVTASNENDFSLYIGNDTSSVEIKYDSCEGRVSLKRDETDDGLRRTEYRPKNKLKIRIFIDASSIEVFFGEGEVTFSSRFFIDSSIHVRLADDSIADSFTVYAMKNTLYNK